MCKKLIYLLSLVFVLSMVLTGPANAAGDSVTITNYKGVTGTNPFSIAARPG